jgi:SAM-dependent methyltransferase
VSHTLPHFCDRLVCGTALSQNNGKVCDTVSFTTLQAMSDAIGVECVAEENHEWLLSEFVRLLLQHEPESVLDVGCGAGLLLRNCIQAGIETVGLDQPGPRLDTLRDEGLEVREGSAYALPFDDRSVDWITMRHIPHHLEDPARAVAEGLRVARTGLLIAEPCFDSTLPSQRGGLAVDRWEKRQHRSGGMYHAEYLDLGALIALLPEDSEDRFDIEAHRSLRLRRRSIGDFARAAAELVSDLPWEHAEQDALVQLLGELRHLGLSWNGSLCVALRRR